MILKSARGQDNDHHLVRLDRAGLPELHHGREGRRRRGLDEEALFARQRALGFEDPLVRDPHAGAAGVPQGLEPLKGSLRRGDREGDRGAALHALGRLELVLERMGKRPERLGGDHSREVADDFEVTSGLSERDTAILNKAAALKDGQAVEELKPAAK